MRRPGERAVPGMRAVPGERAVLLAVALCGILPPLNTFFGFNDLSTPMCLATAAPPNCGTDTLVAGADITSWGYATDKLFGPALQSRLGQIAASRATRNPF